MMMFIDVYLAIALRYFDIFWAVSLYSENMIAKGYGMESQGSLGVDDKPNFDEDIFTTVSP